MVKKNIFYAYQAGLVAHLPNYVSRILPPWLLVINCIICARIKWWNVCEPSLHIPHSYSQLFPFLARSCKKEQPMVHQHPVLHEEKNLELQREEV